MPMSDGVGHMVREWLFLARGFSRKPRKVQSGSLTPLGSTAGAPSQSALCCELEEAHQDSSQVRRKMETV